MWTTTESPVGPLRIVARDGAVTAIEFDDADTDGGADDAGARPTSSVARARRIAEGRPRGERMDDAPVLVDACTQLAEYFRRARSTFDLPLAPEGTDFQQRVWGALRMIEYGQTVSYGEIATRLGMTGAASRAVGLANGRNPIPIVVPCHRVVGADGSLTGYAGGVARKQLLLDLEQDALFTLS